MVVRAKRVQNGEQTLYHVGAFSDETPAGAMFVWVRLESLVIVN